MRTILLGAVALVLGGSSICWARIGPVCPSSPFDFSVAKPKKKGKGIIERILDHVDGGGFHGFDSPDPATRKSEDPLGTKTVRWQVHF